MENVQVSSISDKNDGYLHEDQYTFLIISRSFLLRMRNILFKIYRENQNTNFARSIVFPIIVPFMR